MFEKARTNEARYSEAAQSEDTETLLSEGSSQAGSIHKTSRWELSRLSSSIVIAVGFCLAGAIGAGLGSRWSHNMAATCTAYTSHYSNVMKDVPITYAPVRYNGSFMHENVYRQEAGPAVDAAWEALGVDYRAAVVPEDEAIASGLTLDHVKIDAKYGGGYPANVEGLHHLHCLNLLRKSLYYNYDYYRPRKEGAFKNEDHVVRKHVSHCLDIIRQQLMCTVDIGVLGQVWWGTEADPHPFVDFNTQHMCRNYEDIRRWAEKHQLPADAPADLLVQPTSGQHIYAEIP